MIKNIIIGKKSTISKFVHKDLQNSIVLSANNLNEFILKKEIEKSKKINLIFNNFYPSKDLNTLTIKNFKKFCELSLEKFFLFLKKFPLLK